MLAIWGTDALSLKMYARLPEEDRKRTFLLTSGVHEGRNTDGLSAPPRIIEPNRLSFESVAKLLIPSSVDSRGSLHEKAVYWSILKNTPIRDDRIWVMDYPTFDRELSDHGSLDAFLASNTIPYLLHMEFEVSHQCNLNCKGCTHFTPLSKKKFGDFEDFVKDLTRIRQMVDNIGHIQLLGGEPLLNPEINRYVETAREIYPHSEINVVTNGLLLGSVNDALKETMRRTGAIFRVSLYPPVKNDIKTIIAQTKQAGISCTAGYDAEFFYALLDPGGRSDPSLSNAMCTQSLCHVFEKGRLNQCVMAHKIRVFEEYFQMGSMFPDCDIDLYAEGLTPLMLQEYLMHPIEMCRFCGTPRPFPWAPAGKTPSKEDWYCDELPGKRTF